MMDDAQKKKIQKLRNNGAGYSEIAKVMGLPVNTVKTFCRRNGLTGDRRETQLPKRSRNNRKYYLIDAEDRGNSTSPETSAGLGNAGVLRNRVAVEVTVSFADDPDETAVADVMNMLATADYSEGRNMDAEVCSDEAN